LKKGEDAKRRKIDEAILSGIFRRRGRMMGLMGLMGRMGDSETHKLKDS